MGTSDEIFDNLHMHEFHDSLEAGGVKCEKVAVPGMTHAFDMGFEIGSSVAEDIIRPAVEWLACEAGVCAEAIGSDNDA
jgi:acetyl esterase/lipase